MSDDIDRTDELLELDAEDQRREAAADNGWTDHIPLPPEPDEPPDDQVDDQVDDEVTWWEKAVRSRATQYKIEREARQRVDDEMRPPVHYPPVRSLTAMLAEPDIATRYRIADVAPADARIMLSAQYKAGKSTLVGNLIRALADGEPFSVTSPSTPPHAGWCSSMTR
jgi:hypothetical protein